MADAPRRFQARFRPSPQTFFVEEVPAYLPCGSGEHTFLWIEKRGTTTLAAIDELARRLGVPAREIGYAGMKDRHATTRQWLSAPRVAPEAALMPPTEGAAGVRVLRAERHGNKLRVGHLHANRFTVHLGAVRDAAEARALEAGLAELARDGLPNFYGDQRFGASSSNVEEGIALLRPKGIALTHTDGIALTHTDGIALTHTDGIALTHQEGSALTHQGGRAAGARRGGGPRDHRRRKLLLSAVQSAVFNQVLARRLADGRLRRVLDGDILQKTDNGGVFYTDDPALDQARVDAGAVVITGPMPGSWARAPAQGTAARAIEDEALAAVGITRDELGALGKELPGARRPLWVPVALEDQPLRETPTPEEVRPASRADAGAVTLSFRLPAGTYATVLLSALGVAAERVGGAEPGDAARPELAPDAPEPAQH
jgi:tRNA pseudouridine13 synthase